MAIALDLVRTSVIDHCATRTCTVERVIDESDSGITKRFVYTSLLLLVFSLFSVHAYSLAKSLLSQAHIIIGISVFFPVCQKHSTLCSQ